METLWYDERCADGAAAAGDPVVRALDALLDPPSEHVERWTALA